MMNEIDLRHLDLNLLVTFEVLMREGNVTHAAKRLNRTQSAVSHALARLREQLGDPLMIKAKGRMCPTPFAVQLADDIRPILRNIQRVVAPPEPFDPKTSQRVFRLAFPDYSPALMADVIARVQEQAPGVAIDWLTPSEKALAGVEAGLIDVASMAGELALPQGIEVQLGLPHSRMTYARKDHPAVKDWGVAAWQRWPHIKVKLDNGTISPVETVAQKGGPQRRIGAWIANLTAVAPLLAQTDLLATFPPLMMAEAAVRFDLAALKPPVHIPPLQERFLWSFRLTNDPGSRWFRNLVIDVFNQHHERAEKTAAKTKVLNTPARVKPPSRDVRPASRIGRPR
jgi:DNA-binding transcriptional LysR family regulator